MGNTHFRASCQVWGFVKHVSLFDFCPSYFPPSLNSLHLELNLNIYLQKAGIGDETKTYRQEKTVVLAMY